MTRDGAVRDDARHRLNLRSGHLAVVAQDPTDGLVVRMPPPEAERVARWVRIDLVPLGGGQIFGCLQQAGTKGDGLGVRARRVVDVNVEMDLLGVTYRSLRPHPMAPLTSTLVARQGAAAAGGLSATG